MTNQQAEGLFRFAQSNQTVIAKFNESQIVAISKGRERLLRYFISLSDKNAGFHGFELLEIIYLVGQGFEVGLIWTVYFKFGLGEGGDKKIRSDKT